jgi:hypothetical protein
MKGKRMTMTTEPFDLASRPRPEQTTITIVGTVRNGGRSLAADVARLAAATEGFAARRFFISESDSDDDTVDQLRRLEKARDDFAFESAGRLAPSMPLRTERIAHGRNRCVDYVRQLAGSPDDVVLVADLDGINDRLTAGGLRSCWDLPVRWDVCTANRGGAYYDIYALRCAGWVDEDCVKATDLLAERMDRTLASWLVTRSRMIVLPRTHPPILVESAFGGLGIYRRAVFDGFVYEGLAPDGSEICEHLSAHRQIVDAGGAIYINTAMVGGGRPPFPGKKMLQSIKQKLKR